MYNWSSWKMDPIGLCVQLTHLAAMAWCNPPLSVPYSFFTIYFQMILLGRMEVLPFNGLTKNLLNPLHPSVPSNVFTCITPDNLIFQFLT